MAGKGARMELAPERIVPIVPIMPIYVPSTYSGTDVWCAFISNTMKYFTAGMFQTRSNFAETDKVVLLVDSRQNLAHFWSIPWTLYMLGPDWRLQIITKAENVPFYQSLVRLYELTGVYVDSLEKRYGYGSWIDDGFMHRVQFFLAKQFWQGIRGEYIINIQDHGVPLRRLAGDPEMEQLLSKLFKYGYAGAPWPDAVGGNGGFSYRRKSVLLQHTEDVGVHFSLLLSKTADLSRLGTAHEDTVLCTKLRDQEVGLPSQELLQQFSSETILNQKSFGVHNIAPRHDQHAVQEKINLALKSFFLCDEDLMLLSGDTIQHSSDLHVWQKMQEIYPNSTHPTECKGLI